MNQKHKIPYVFILDYLHPKEVKIKPMFGCFGLYVDDKIIFFLRDRKEKPELNGVWVAVGTHDCSGYGVSKPIFSRYGFDCPESGEAREFLTSLSEEIEGWEAAELRLDELV